MKIQIAALLLLTLASCARTGQHVVRLVHGVTTPVITDTLQGDPQEIDDQLRVAIAESKFDTLSMVRMGSDSGPEIPWMPKYSAPSSPTNPWPKSPFPQRTNAQAAPFPAGMRTLTVWAAQISNNAVEVRVAVDSITVSHATGKLEVVRTDNGQERAFLDHVRRALPS